MQASGQRSTIPARRHTKRSGPRATSQESGCYGTDRFFPGRRAIKHLTGNYKVPTLVLDDGTVIDDFANIATWAAQHPHTPTPQTAGIA
jgi:hypothetical protein